MRVRGYAPIPLPPYVPCIPVRERGGSVFEGTVSLKIFWKKIQTHEEGSIKKIFWKKIREKIQSHIGGGGVNSQGRMAKKILEKNLNISWEGLFIGFVKKNM